MANGDDVIRLPKVSKAVDAVSDGLDIGHGQPGWQSPEWREAVFAMEQVTDGAAALNSELVAEVGAAVRWSSYFDRRMSEGDLRTALEAECEEGEPLELVAIALALWAETR